MATRLTPAEIREAFKVFEVPHVEVAGWESRSNRSGWGDPRVTGVMYHHTASDASDLSNRNLIRDGHASLSGPLANFGATDTGKIEIIAAGSANHAGGGDPDTLKLVQTEQTPIDREVKPDGNSDSAGAVNGNPRFYGWESYYGIGSDPTPNPLQHRVTVLSMAAIIWALDKKDGGAVAWTGRAAIGHREWTNRKIDPSAVKMHEVRQDISWLLKTDAAHRRHWYKTGSRPIPTAPPPAGGPVTTPTTPPPPAPVYKGTAAAQEVVKALLASDVFPSPDPTSKTNPYWGGGSWFRYVGEWSRESVITNRRLEDKVDDLTTQVAQLTALVEKLAAAHLPQEPQA
jgi:hypothetical protein